MAKMLKILIFILLVSITGINSKRLLAQSPDFEKRYSFVFINIPLEEVIDLLRKSVNYGFSYNSDILPRNKIINVSFKNEPLHTIFDSIFHPLHLSYKLVNKTIVIIKLQVEEEKHLPVAATDTVKFIQLSGRILERKRKAPVPFVNIYLKNKDIGTISNGNGDFIIKIPVKNTDDSIFFSSIGYNTYVNKISNLWPDQNLIFLDEVYLPIQEITVNYVDAVTVIKNALNRIPVNYSRNPLMLTAFYRETIMQNRDYVALSEAILSIYKAPYNNFGSDQVMIFKGRKSPFLKQMDTVRFKFQGGIYNCLLLDIAKNPSNFLSDEFIEQYDYKIADITNIQERTTYVVEFDQKDYVRYPLYKGQLYIDKETFAIVRADFMLSPKGLEYASGVLVQKSPAGLKVKPVSSNYVVNYIRRNNRWELNYIREEVKFKVNRKFYISSKLFALSAEMVITQTDSINVRRLKYSETVRSKDIFVEKVGKYDEDFWGGFNFIKPDESLEQALEKIKAYTR